MKPALHTQSLPPSEPAGDAELASHMAQEAVPMAPLNCPAGQATHDEPVNPAEQLQSVTESDPVPLDLPEGQLLHPLAPAELEYCPEGQF